MRAWVAANPFNWVVGRLRDALLDGRLTLERGDAVAIVVALMLFIVTVHFGRPQPGTYEPPRMENGRIVPGHIEPSR